MGVIYMKISNNFFKVDFDDAGALISIIYNVDKYKANFVLSSNDEPWVPRNKQWGLGFITSGHNHVQIDDCISVEYCDNSMKAVYLAEYDDLRFGCVWNGDIEQSKLHRKLLVTVERTLCDDGLYEAYMYENLSDKYMVLDEVGIYSSFRDTYATGNGVLNYHFNQHICTAGDLCYIMAQRQSANDDNMSLITLEGSFDTYQLEEQNTSNVRGVVALVAKDIRIAAGESITYKRIITPYTTNENFENKLLEYTGFPIVDFGTMTVEKGNKIRVAIKKPGKLYEIKIEGEKLVCKDDAYEYEPSDIGIYNGKIIYGDKIAKLVFRVIDKIDTLLKKRAEFIVEHQQINDINDPRYGAYMPYDTEREKIYKVEEIEKIYYEVPDRNEARERMGMGAFIAMYSRVTGDMRFLPSLERYRDFLLKYIVDANGDVWDSYLRQEGEKYYSFGLLVEHKELDMRFRSYNYNFVLPFFIEMYNLTKDVSYAKIAIRIFEKYYDKYNLAGFMPIETEISNALKEIDDSDFLNAFEKVKCGSARVLKEICSTGDNYEPGEVLYEHGHVSSDTMFLTEYCLAYNNREIMTNIGDGIKRTLSFDGNQPNYNVNGIPIRHWDGFWFGKLELWGDTMPHWIDFLSANSYFNYYLITGDKSYRENAMKMFMANMTLINKDGSAYNCYLFNEKSNGRQAGRYDPISNDQDWMFYQYLKCMEKEKKYKEI